MEVKLLRLHLRTQAPAPRLSMDTKDNKGDKGDKENIVKSDSCLG